MLQLSFKGERLVGMQASDLSWLIEEYFRLKPGICDTRTATLFFDEIQLVDIKLSFTPRQAITGRRDPSKNEELKKLV